MKRLEKIEKCIECETPISAVTMIASIMVGILYDVAVMFSKKFCENKSAPKFHGFVKKLEDWKIHELIEMSYKIGLIDEDVRKLCQDNRHFKNYIHPYKEIKTDYTPDKHTISLPPHPKTHD